MGFLGRRREKAQGKAGGEGKGERARTRREADEGSTRPARRNRRQALSLSHREVKRADVGGDEEGGGSLGRRGSSTRFHPAGGRHIDPAEGEAEGGGESVAILDLRNIRVLNRIFSFILREITLKKLV